MQKKIKETKGITLVALVITIIILLILAGVALSLVIGENGLIAKSKEGVEKYKDKAKEEQWQLEDIEVGMAELKDEEEHPELKQMKLLLNITEDNKEIQLPVYMNTDENYTYDCTVNWGDGTTQQVTNENAKTTKHTYGNTGEYTLVIEGTYESLYYNDSIQKTLKKVEQWGTTGLKYIDLYDCEKLEEVAEPSKNSFVKVTEFNGTFSMVSSLTSIPENLFSNCKNAINFGSVFYGCSSLKEIPERLFANCPNVMDFGSAFAGCTGITSIPERLFANCPNVTYFGYTFAGCSSVTSIPEKLFANCPNVINFGGAFSKCSSLTGKSIQLWNEDSRQEKGITENSGGAACYYMCENLDDYSEIPSHWKIGLGPPTPQPPQ